MSLLEDTPTVQDRDPQPYVAVHDTVSMQEIPRLADRLPGLIAGLASRGRPLTGPPFFRYRTIDMERSLDLEAGAPVSPGDAEETEPGTVAGVLPAGRYVTADYVGDPSGLVGATGELLAWAADEGLIFDRHDGPNGEVWGCRLELLLTNPSEEPDTSTWRTRLAFKLAE